MWVAAITGARLDEQRAAPVWALLSRQALRRRRNLRPRAAAPRAAAEDGVAWIGADLLSRAGGGTGWPTPVTAAKAGFLESGMPARFVAAAAAVAAGGVGGA